MKIENGEKSIQATILLNSNVVIHNYTHVKTGLVGKFLYHATFQMKIGNEMINAYCMLITVINQKRTFSP